MDKRFYFPGRIMAKQSAQQDRNFDDLAQRFKKNIYGGLKGDIRLAVLERDCRAALPVHPWRGDNPKPWRILDAGGGQGQFSLQWAKKGHSVVICDISAEMLKLAAEQVEEQNLSDRVELIHAPVQDLHLHIANKQFDFVICHAVMEWLHEPQFLLPQLLNYLAPKGFLSLTFYNLHSLIYKNLLRTNFKKIIDEDFGGARGSLTPINPQRPEEVLAWVEQLPMEVLCHSGIRVFHDYIFNEEHRARDPENLVKMELEFSRQEPYRSLGRYVHLLLQRNN
jgi:S-adenosylmethionine-dependent methyltransferase